LVLDGTATEPAGEGRKLLEDQGIRIADKDGLAVVTCPDGTRLELAGRTLLRFAAAPAPSSGDRLVRLDAGTLTADVARQPAGRRRLILTPNARAEVLGTRLTLSVEADASTLTVEKGRVRLVRLADGAAVVVGAGQVATAAHGAPLRAETIPAVTGFTLVNADTDRDIGPLQDGAVIDLARMPTKNLNIRAETRPRKVGCVRFVLDDGAVDRIETGSTGPLYSLAGDQHGDYRGWKPAPGRHVLTATPYVSPDTRGPAGQAATLTFTVVGKR
jgi:hypothetical protein